MKTKILSFLAALFAAAALQAQPFTTASVGVSVGTDGFGIEAATQIDEHFQLRAGYSFAPGWPAIQVYQLNVPEHPGNDASANIRVPLLMQFRQNHGRLLINYYPWAYGNFFISAGAYAGDPVYLGAGATGMPEDYNTAGIAVGNYTVKAHDGKINARLRGWTVQPYLGIGFGRPVWERSLVSVVFDLGVRYAGQPSIQAWGDGLTQSGWIDIDKKDLGTKNEKIFNTAQNLLSFYPTVSVRVFFNIYSKM